MGLFSFVKIGLDDLAVREAHRKQIEADPFRKEIFYRLAVMLSDRAGIEVWKAVDRLAGVIPADEFELFNVPEGLTVMYCDAFEVLWAEQAREGGAA